MLDLGEPLKAQKMPLRLDRVDQQLLDKAVLLARPF